jgi:DNA-binding MarR family transcriptional regulator
MGRRERAEELAEQLHSAAIRVLRLVRVQDMASGVAPARLSALSVLVFGGPLSLQDLARAEQVRPPTMSRIVDALEKQKLARRTVDPQDGRALQIAATKKGTALLIKGRERRVKFLASYLSKLNDRELAHLREALAGIHKALQSR